MRDGGVTFEGGGGSALSAGKGVLCVVGAGARLLPNGGGVVEE